MEEQRKPSQLPPQLNVVLLPTTVEEQQLLARETNRVSEGFVPKGNAPAQFQTKTKFSAIEESLNPLYVVMAPMLSANRFFNPESHQQLTASAQKDLPRGNPYDSKIVDGSVSNAIHGVPEAFKPYLERHLHQKALTYLVSEYRAVALFFYFGDKAASEKFGIGSGRLAREMKITKLSETHIEITFTEKGFQHIGSMTASAAKFENAFSVTLDLQLDDKMALDETDIAATLQGIDMTRLGEDTKEREKALDLISSLSTRNIKVSLKGVELRVFGAPEEKDEALGQIQKTVSFHQKVLDVGFKRFIGKQNKPGSKVEQSTKIVDWLSGAVLLVEPNLVGNEKTKAAYQRLAPYQNAVSVKTKNKQGNPVTQTFFKKADGEIYSYTSNLKENYFLTVEKYLKGNNPNPAVVSCMDILDALSTISNQLNRLLVIHFIEKAHENAFASTRLAIATLREQANQPSFTQDTDRTLALLAELEDQITAVESSITKATTPQELDQALQAIDFSELNTIFKNHVEAVLGEKTVFDLYVEKNPDARPPKNDDDINQLLVRGLKDKDLHVLIGNLFISGKLSLADELPRLNRSAQTTLLSTTLLRGLRFSNYECFAPLQGNHSFSRAFFDAFTSLDTENASKLFDSLRNTALEEIFNKDEPTAQNILANLANRTNKPGFFTRQFKKDYYRAASQAAELMEVAKAISNNEVDFQRIETLSYDNKQMLLQNSAFIRWVIELTPAQQTSITQFFLNDLSVRGKYEMRQNFSRITPSQNDDPSVESKIKAFKKLATALSFDDILKSPTYMEFDPVNNPGPLVNSLGTQKLGELAAADTSGKMLEKLIEGASQPKKTPWIWEKWIQRFYVTPTIAKNRLIATQEHALERAITKLTDQFFAPAAYENLDQAHKQQLATYINSQTLSTKGKLSRCVREIEQKLEEAAKQKLAAGEPTAVSAEGTPPATSHYTGITGTLADSALSSSPSPRESLFESGSPTASLKKVADSAKEIVPTPISPAKESFTPTSSQSAPTLGANGDPAAKKRLDFSNASLSIDDKGKDEAIGLDNRKAVSAGGSSKLPKHGK